jgi:glycosyltransferase involved in cell wall biosynthesis
MKVIFLPTGNYEVPSSRYRCYYFAEELRKHGFDVTVVPSVFSMHTKPWRRKLSQHTKNVLTKFNILRKAKNQVIYVQRGIFQHGVIQLYSLFKSRKLVFDFDDAIYTVDQEKVSKMIKLSKLIIAGNEHLKNYSNQFNKNVYVVPTSINTDAWKPLPKKGKDEPVIGWIGTHTNLKFLNILVKPLEKLSQKYDFIFKIISAFDFPQYTPPDFRGVHVERVKWSLNTEIQELSEVDIGVYPLPDNEWARGKCGLKTLQYMAMEIAPVCSAVGINNLMFKDRFNGFLIRKEDEWFKKLSLLIKNEALRKSLGKNARATVEETYSLRSNGEKLANILKTLDEKRNREKTYTNLPHSFSHKFLYTFPRVS